MENFDISPVVKACDLALQLFSANTDDVASTLFLGLYSGPNDPDEISRAIFALDAVVGPSLDEKIDKWTDDCVNIEDLRKLNLSDEECALIAMRLENARDNIPLLLGKEDCRHSYSLRIHAVDESIAVQWALTAFWTVSRDFYVGIQSLYFSDVISDREAR